MKKSIRNNVIAGTLCALMATSATTFAMAHRGGHFDPAHMMEHLSDKLSLSDNQREEIEQIHISSRDHSADDRARLEELRTELHAMRAEFDAGAAQEIADEIGEISARMSYGMASTQAQVYQQLDAQQREEFDQILASRDKRRDRKRGR